VREIKGYRDKLKENGEGGNGAEEKGVWGIGEAPRLGKLLLDLGSGMIIDTFYAGLMSNDAFGNK
jgi:hypothetical protein